MATDSILTSIPFWIVIAVIFVIAVAWAVCLGTRVNPFRACANCSTACVGCGRILWSWLTCCCRPRDAEMEETVKKKKEPNEGEDLEEALRELKELRDRLPLLPLQPVKPVKPDECKWDRRDYLLERAQKLPTVV